MAETPDTDKLVKKEPEGPAPDPIASRSTSFVVLISALLLMAVLGWALYDEVYGQRNWKGYQQEFVSRYNRYLRRLKREKAKNVEAGTEKEVKERPEYQELVASVNEHEPAPVHDVPVFRHLGAARAAGEVAAETFAAPHQVRLGHTLVQRLRSSLSRRLLTSGRNA